MLLDDQQPRPLQVWSTDREIREVIDILLRSIAQNEGFARDLSELAHQLGEEGHATAARGMLDLSRRRQIKNIEGRARIFALADRYGQSYDHPTSSAPRRAVVL